MTTLKNVTLLLAPLLLAACGGGGDKETTEPTPTTPDTPNIAPQIDAITDQTVRPSTVASIIANATDPDGQIAEYTWQQKSGTSVTLNNPSSQQVTFNVPAITEEELLTFEVTVKDNQGATANQQAFVHVKPNRAPAFNFIRDETTDINQPVTIAASAYDRDGTIASYKWEQTAGTHVTIADPDSQALSFTSPTLNREETLTFKVTATDNEGATGSRTVDVTVQNAGNLIENLTFENNSIKLCVDALKEGNNWKFVDEVTHFTCRYGYHKDIEQFTSLTKLDIQNTTSSSPVSINFEAFPNLTELKLIQSSGISDIDVSQNTLLEKLTVSEAKFASVNLANNANIKEVFLHRVPDLTNLDLVHNTKLTSLTVFGSQVQDLNLSHNVMLETVRVFGVNGHPELDGKLQSISLPSTDKLTQLKLSANQLQSIDTANLSSLTDLDLSQNQLNLVSLTKNVKLTHLRLKENALASLDLMNNAALTVVNISDTGASEIDTSHLTELSELYTANKSLSTFSSNHYSKLTKLDLSENPISTIELTDMPLLRAVKLSRTLIHSLDASNASNLVELEIKASPLNSITLPNESSKLAWLEVSFSSLSHLPVQQYTNLLKLEAAGNQLIDIDIRALTKLRTLHLGSNSITNLDISQNTLLRCVSVYDTTLTDNAKETLDNYASEFPLLDEITYTKATAIGQCGYDPYTPTP